jgi:thioredoxin reductase (NADPH)
MYDVVIIGAGPAGLSAAFWCDELGLDTLLLEKSDSVGGQVQLESVDLKSKCVSLQSGEQLKTISIILATGVRRRELGIPGEREFIGKGIIESAARDRDQFAGRDVCIIGGGDSAAENALALAEVCATVTLVHRGKTLRARREFVEKLQTDHRVTVFTESQVTRIMGRDQLEAVEIKRKEGLKPFQVAVGGVLVRIGVVPNSELFKDQIPLDEAGYIRVQSTQETTQPFVFAIGDVANPLAPTVSGATGSGATAAKVIASRLTRGQRSS